MESIQSIKARIKTIQSIQKAANAMKLISSIKLSKLNKDVIYPSSDILRNMLSYLIAEGLYNKEPILSEFLNINNNQPLVIILNSNQGFCGAFKQGINSKANELILSLDSPEVKVIDPNKPEEIDFYKYNRPIYIVSGKFINILRQEATYQKIFPIEPIDFRNFTKLNYFGKFADLFDFILNKYFVNIWNEIIYHHLLSELSIRVMSTDKMYRNADDMSKDLNLLYNRTRQAKITQELTEIVSSVECLQ